MKTIHPDLVPILPSPKPPPRRSGITASPRPSAHPTRPSFHPTHPSLHPTRPEIRLTQPSIPVSGADIEEVLPATIVRGVAAVNDITPVHARSALSTQEATVIVQESDNEFRSRVAAEVNLLVRQALAAMQPPPPRTDHGASVRWLLVGLVFGALFVYVLMAGSLREKDAAIAQARSAPIAAHGVVAPPPPTPAAAPLVCSATGESLASVIPTVDVDELPKHPAPPGRHVTPRKATPKPTSNLDEENPYADVSPE